MKTKLTPEQLTEKFFAEVEGWERKIPSDEETDNGWNACWVNSKGEQMIPSTEPLPPIHKSLDLCWTWVKPEIEKAGIHWGDFVFCCIEGTLEETCEEILTIALKELGVEV